MTHTPQAFERGIFTFSLDFELIWGTLDLPYYPRFVRLCERERESVVTPLLELVAEFNISATWCTVGHLFLDKCSHDGRRHPEIIRSSAYDALRLNRDPGTCEHDDPIFYGRELVERIRDCRVPQEVGSHTFSHVLFGDRACSRATALSEIEAAVSAATELGIDLRSLAFPRNRVGHADLLAAHGFTCYRAPDQVWYEMLEQRRWYHRAAHMLDVLTASTPPVVFPRWDPAGLWAIPGSMLYTPSFGVRRWIPVSLRVERARKGLLAAINQRGLFHLWLHPTDLVERRIEMLDGLRRIFAMVAEMRSKGELDVLSMGGLVERLHKSGSNAPSMAQEVA